MKMLMISRTHSDALMTLTLNSNAMFVSDLVMQLLSMHHQLNNITFKILHYQHNQSQIFELRGMTIEN